MDTSASSERAERVRRLFDELVEMEPAARRARIEEIRREDESLGSELADLLAADEEGGSLLDDVEQSMRSYREAVVNAEDDRPRLIGQTVAHYIVLERLGRGGMGEVFKAWDTRLDRTVALKFLPPALSSHEKAKRRFVQEAKAASVLEHPNICTIFEIGESAGRQLYIAMPCYGGETLSEKIGRGPMPIEEAVGVAMQMAAGLERAHEAGIVHRDVKPANVIVADHEIVKLLDFGIAEIADKELTRTGLRLGTVAYMSPEHARGDAPDRSMDVWSLGVVLYEMLTGERPFRGSNDVMVLEAIHRSDPVPVRERRPDVPLELAEIVERALRKDPAERYASMDALSTALRRAAEELRKPAYPLPYVQAGDRAPAPDGAQEVAPDRHSLAEATAAERSDPPAPRRRRTAVLTLAAGIAVLAGFGLWQWFAASDAEPVPAATGHSIAVVHFENLTEDSTLQWVEAGLAEMLTASLSRFDGVDVLSRQRLFDLARQVGIQDPARFERSAFSEVARRAGVRTMLLGSVLGDRDHLRLNVQLVDAATGDLVGAEVVDAGANSSLFALADTLTQRLAESLRIRSPGGPDRTSVAYTLTSSPRALRQYVEGLQAMYGSRFTEAIAAFEAAAAIDSAFAMAYYHRALAHSWQTGTADRDALERARRYGDRLTRRERDLIEATFTMLEDLPTRKTAFERLTERYPAEKFAWYQLGEILYHNYWPRRSVGVFRRAVELDPHFLIGYIHLVDFFVHGSDPERARPILNDVLALDSSSVEFQMSSAYLDFAASGDDADRIRLVRLLERVAGDSSASPFSRLDARATLAMLTRDFDHLGTLLRQFRNQGHYGTEGYLLATNALAGLALMRGGQPDRYLYEARQRQPASPAQLYEDGLFRLLRGDPGPARDRALTILDLYQDGTEPFAEVAALGWHLHFLAHLPGEAPLDAPSGAGQALAELERLQADSTNEYGFLYADAAGRLACRNGSVASAMAHFERARSSTSFTGTHTGVVLPFGLLVADGQLACLEQAASHGDLLRAAETVSAGVYHFHDLNASSMLVRLRMLLRRARSLEALGQREEALATYDDVASIWSEARDALPEVREGLARRSELRDRPGR